MKEKSKVPDKKLLAELPQPMEFAKLAATLSPDDSPSRALKKAMEFYVEAVLFSDELPADIEGLVRHFGNQERRLALMARPIEAAIEADWKNTVDLEPAKNDDEARR